MAQDIVSIKGSKNGLIIYLNTYHELEELKTCLIQKLESAKGFFQGAHFFLKPQGRDFTVEQRKELETLCKEYGLIPKKQPEKETTHRDSDNISKTEINGILPAELKGKNQLVQGSIRNGQKQHYEGNVILLGDVNPGGQITATGSIIVMGTLKGIAHGGTNGDTDSFIMAYDFRPHQIRIAQTVARNPENSPLPTKTPEIARLINNTIVIEKYPRKKFRKIV